MPTKYKVSTFDEIQEIEITRETPKFIFYRWAGNGPERQVAKHSEWANYFDTWEAAYKFLVDRALVEIAEGQRITKRGRERLKAIRNLKLS